MAKVEDRWRWYLLIFLSFEVVMASHEVRSSRDPSDQSWSQRSCLCPNCLHIACVFGRTTRKCSKIQTPNKKTTWVFPKIVVPPNRPFVHRGFHYFHHPFNRVPVFLQKHPHWNRQKKPMGSPKTTTKHFGKPTNYQPQRILGWEVSEQMGFFHHFEKPPGKSPFKRRNSPSCPLSQGCFCFEFVCFYFGDQGFKVWIPLPNHQG